MEELDPRAVRIVADPAAGLEAIAGLPLEEQVLIVKAATRSRPELINTDPWNEFVERNKEELNKLFGLKP